MRYNKLFFILFLVFSIFTSTVYCESSTAEPYTEEEFPETLHKLRRFEIITLGSMPFVSLDVSLGFSTYKLASGKSSSFINPFSSSSSETAYTEDEIKGIIITSLAISLGVGVSDFIVNQIKENKAKKQIKAESQNVTVSIADDPEAVKIILPEEEQ